MDYHTTTKNIAPQQFRSRRFAPPKRPARTPHRSASGPQETRKSIQTMPKRAPRRSQDHHRIESIFFYFFKKNQKRVPATTKSMFSKVGVILDTQNRPAEVPHRGKRRMRLRERQEATEKPPKAPGVVSKGHLPEIDERLFRRLARDLRPGGGLGERHVSKIID